MTETRVYPIERLHEFTRSVLEQCGVPTRDATTAADVLAAADIRGIDSHGVARLHAYYDMLTLGRINPKASPRIERETATTATVDGDNGLGLVVGPFANRVAMAKAESHGSGWVTVCNTNHFGIAGWYVMEAAARGLIGWAMTNSTKLVTPHLGAQRMLGTNPIAIAFPGGADSSIVIDLATCAAAYGKVEIAKRGGKDIPEGWAIDRNGVPTTDPSAMIDGGALLPLGSDSDRSGHKGYALAIMVDVLCAVLSGANYGPFTPPFALRQEVPERSVGRGIGHFFGALRVDGFIDPSVFRSRIEDFVHVMRATRPAPGTEGPIIPGDPERAAEIVRRRDGVPLVMPVVLELRDIARATGIPFD